MLADKLPITGPCPIDLDAIGFDRTSKVSHCTHCAKSVTNLSNMTRDEARAFMREHEGEKLCVSYACDSTGNIRFRTAPEPALVPVTRLRPRPAVAPAPVATAPARRTSRAAGFVAALGVSAALAACAPHGEPPRDVTVEGNMKVPHERVLEEPPKPVVDPQPDPIPRAGAAVIPHDVMVEGEMKVPDSDAIDEPCDGGKDATKPDATKPDATRPDRDTRRSIPKPRPVEVAPDVHVAGGLTMPDLDAIEAPTPAPKRRS